MQVTGKVKSAAVWVPAGVVGLWLIGVNALGADFQTGVEAFGRGDYQTAFQEFQVLAMQGHVDAQNNLGVLYNTGKGIPQNYAEAAHWYLLAAERGHPDAQTNIAVLYAEGAGVPQDWLHAYAWFNLAAAQGIDVARTNRDLIAERLSPEQLSKAQQLFLMAPALAQSTPVLEKPTAPLQQKSDASQAAAGHDVKPALAAKYRLYGPVVKGETFWTIAQKLKRDGDDIGQLLRSLLDANPQAALAGGGRLKPGAMLRVPDKGGNAITSERTTRPEKAALTRDIGLYGPIQQGETLWSIASRLKPSGITTEQMMMALAKANPTVIPGGNFARLKPQVTLRVPTVQEIVKIDKVWARAQVGKSLTQ